MRLKGSCGPMTSIRIGQIVVQAEASGKNGRGAERPSAHSACRLWEELPQALRKRAPVSVEEEDLVAGLVERACAAGVELSLALRISGLSWDRYRIARRHGDGSCVICKEALYETAPAAPG